MKLLSDAVRKNTGQHFLGGGIMTVSRREFIKFTGITVAATCVGGIGSSGCTARGISDTPSAPVGSYRVKDANVFIALSEVAVLKQVGEAVKISLPGEDGSELKLIVLHPRNEAYLAFADRCSHKGKELNYLHEEGKLACSGLRSQFDLGGNVIRRPAEEPLQRYVVTLKREYLIIYI
jgi:Rieske Fe-S protein